MKRTKKAFLTVLLAGVVMLFCTCSPEPAHEPLEFRSARQITLNWNKYMLELERHSPGYRPPVSSRTFAYVEMAAYETSVSSLPSYYSLEQICPGFQKPSLPAMPVYLPAALNASYARIIRLFFPTAPKNMLDKIPELEAQWANELASEAGAEQVQTAIKFGRDVAEAVWKYSKTDHPGHEGFLNNYDQNYVSPDCPGCWKPDIEHGIEPLLPYWGQVRPFAIKPGEIAVNAPEQWSDQPQSGFYKEALEVFSASQERSKEDAWIAEFWSDDLPGLTVTPAGRWISIANQAVEKSTLGFPETMEMYLRVSLALCDASIVCWDAKYRHSVERPVSYIRNFIDPAWSPLHDSPNFPAYPSGHSSFGAAAAEVLTAYLGDHFELTDRTHQNRIEFASNPRTYKSFVEMAQENAYSRVLIGVHYRMDCIEGLRIGKIVGQKVLAIPLKSSEAYIEK